MAWIAAVGERGFEILPEQSTLSGAFGWNLFDARFDARRLYYTWPNRANMAQDAQELVAGGFYPLLSLKPANAAPTGWSEVASGAFDTEIQNVTANLPVCDFCFHHEPENDSPPNGSIFKAAFNRVAGLLPSHVRPVVCLMDFTFDPASGRNPADWIPSDAEAIALDPYNWYGVTTQTWSWPETIMANSLDYLAADGRPILIWETNTNEHATNTAWKAEWWTRFADLCEAEGITQLTAFDWIDPSGFHLFTSLETADAITQIVARPYWSGIITPPDEDPALLACLDKPNVVVIPNSQYNQHNYVSNTLFDARTQDSIAFPTGTGTPYVTRLGRDTSGVAPNPCYLGGKVVGQQSRNLVWQEVKDIGGGALYLKQPGGAYINGLRCDNVEDGIFFDSLDFTDPNVSDGWTIKNSYMVYTRDDCLSNDDLTSGLIYDCLWEGFVCVSVAWRQVLPAINNSSSTLTIDHLLMHHKEMPAGVAPWDGTTYDTGHLFKTTLSFDEAPAFHIKNSIFLLDDPNGAGEWPKTTTLENVIIVSATGLTSLNSLPGMSIMTDTAVWDNAVADWKTRHGVTDFNNVNMTKFLNPDPPT